MYLVRRFAGARFQRLNALVDEQFGLLQWFIHLVASGSYPFPEVLQALSVPMQVFPAEGMPGHRFHPGNAVLDQVEIRSEELLRTLFATGDEYSATVQPHSCTQANQVVFNTVLGPDDSVVSLAPSHGGHISHTVLVGRRNRVVHYELDPSGWMDYDAVRDLVRRERPRLVIAGASSYPRVFHWDRLRSICDSVGAALHADISHTALFVLTGIHPPAFPFVDFATFNMMKTLRGPNGGVLIYRNAFKRVVPKALFPGTQGGPNENVLLAKLVALEMLAGSSPYELARRVIENARSLASALSSREMRVVTGGSDSHQVLIDLREEAITGLDLEHRCEAVGILTNRNLVPGDLRPPQITSGLRLGTTAVSILGANSDDMSRLGRVIAGLSRSPAETPLQFLDEFRQRYHAQLSASIEAKAPGGA